MRRFTLAALVLGIALVVPMRATADTSPIPVFMPPPSAYAPVPQTAIYPQMPVVFYGVTAPAACAPSCDANCTPESTCSQAPTCDHPLATHHHRHCR